MTNCSLMAGGVLFRVTFCAGDSLTLSVLIDTQKRQMGWFLGLFFKMLKRKERIAVRGQILKEQPGGGAITCGFGDRDKGREKGVVWAGLQEPEAEQRLRVRSGSTPGFRGPEAGSLRFHCCFRMRNSGWHRMGASCCCLVTKSCPALCHPVDSTPPGSSAHGISQARILVWITIFFSRESAHPRDRTRIPCREGRFFTTVPLGASWICTLSMCHLGSTYCASPVGQALF